MGKILIIKGADFSKEAICKVELPEIGGVTISVVSSPSGGGKVFGSGSYKEGTIVQISASANEGYVFVGWNDGNTSITRTITVGSSSQTFTATFREIPAGYEQVTFDGTENWQCATTPNQYRLYNCYLKNPIPSGKKNPMTDSSGKEFLEANCSDSTFSHTKQSFTNTNVASFGYHQPDPSIYFRFDSSIATDATGFKNYLSANPITITYKAEE